MRANQSTYKSEIKIMSESDCEREKINVGQCLKKWEKMNK